MNRAVEMELPLPVPEGADRAVRALAAVGTVKQRTADYVEGVVKYGFRDVPVRVSWAYLPTGTHLVIQAEGSTALGSEDTSALSRIELAVRNLDVPGFVPDRLGMSPATLSAKLAVFALVIVALVLLTRYLGFF